MERSSDVTELLRAWQQGEEDALEPLTERVYDELRRIARAHLRREKAGHTLLPTALVNEAFIRILDQKRVDWRSRAHFFAIASRIMRRVLVDHARRRGADKRRGIHVSLSQALPRGDPRQDASITDLDEALAALEARFPREGKVVELRYFGGLTNEEVAECLGISVATVKRSWTFARSFLKRRLDGSQAGA